MKAQVLDPFNFIMLSMTPNLLRCLKNVTLFRILGELKYLHLLSIGMSSKNSNVFGCSPFGHKSRSPKSSFVASMMMAEFVADGVLSIYSPMRSQVFFCMSLSSPSFTGCL